MPREEIVKLQKPIFLENLLAMTPVPYFGEKAARKYVLYDTYKDSLEHDYVLDYFNAYMHADFVRLRLAAYTILPAVAVFSYVVGDLVGKILTQ